jgi:hypothetical protein
MTMSHVTSVLSTLLLGVGRSSPAGGGWPVEHPGAGRPD